MRSTRRVVTLTPNSQRGFTYLGVLILVMIMGAGLAATGVIWSHDAQREKERELLFVGNQFRQAIESYYRHSPGAAAYPQTLQDLLDDKRFPMPQHHLRRLYRDPVTGKADWRLLGTPDGVGIMGVYSPSEEAPIKTSNFRTRDADFEKAKKYSDWKFFYRPPASTPAAQAPKG